MLNSGSYLFRGPGASGTSHSGEREICHLALSLISFLRTHPFLPSAFTSLEKRYLSIEGYLFSSSRLLVLKVKLPGGDPGLEGDVSIVVSVVSAYISWNALTRTV